ncbi:ATP synthase F1 subunit epsilon [Candidatus Mycoplasma mahonii]|uniref:ATP synthase F1 subunit epsilon n=1 Tax=Candidatus Mycoplasma mahonii TaxID=3004105 RepID=UPI0026E95128|nr:ATP synthase F1 subunit epsilon [Candidatus Mycoplasma mahonii]WKX02153.1 ATP synthase F1 subunit epsilon [Candidatus Mycoplasma mahonii]
MQNKTHLKIMTPNGIFYDKDIAIVTVKTSEGNIGLQHGKSPFIASLEISELTIRSEWGSKIEECAIDGGLVYVTPSDVQIITDSIEYKENIELYRAEQAKKNAELALKTKLEASEELKQRIALKKAINRISVKKS